MKEDINWVRQGKEFNPWDVFNKDEHHDFCYTVDKVASILGLSRENVQTYILPQLDVIRLIKLHKICPPVDNKEAEVKRIIQIYRKIIVLYNNQHLKENEQEMSLMDARYKVCISKKSFYEYLNKVFNIVGVNHCIPLCKIDGSDFVGDDDAITALNDFMEKVPEKKRKDAMKAACDRFAKSGVLGNTFSSDYKDRLDFQKYNIYSMAQLTDGHTMLHGKVHKYSTQIYRELPYTNYIEGRIESKIGEYSNPKARKKGVRYIMNIHQPKVKEDTIYVNFSEESYNFLLIQLLKLYNITDYRIEDGWEYGSNESRIVFRKLVLTCLLTYVDYDRYKKKINKKVRNKNEDMEC